MKNAMFWLLSGLACVLAFACGHTNADDGSNDSEASEVNGVCGVAASSVTPVAADKFIPGSYAGRSFLSPKNHLGEDVAMPEGSAVSLIASGKIVFYGPASGYGELLVAVEHHVAKPITVKNGAGDNTTTDVFVSIYGHLRQSQQRGGAVLGLKTGDCVAAGQVVGYVNDDAHNGDGAEHVHVGARMMSDATAHNRDGATAYRGYDTADGTWKGDFAAAHNVIAAMSASTTWHPDGTLVKSASKAEIYRLEFGKRRHVLTEQDFKNERLFTAGGSTIWNRVVDVTDAEISCFDPGADDISPSSMLLVSCADGRFLVPGNSDLRVRILTKAGTAEDTALLMSWGFSPNEIVQGGASCNRAIASSELMIRDGTLVKEQGKSDVYVVADSVAWPIDTWDTFLSFGFRQENIQVFPAGSLAAHVFGVSQFLLDQSFRNRCMASIGENCADPICLASQGGESGAGGSGTGGAQQGNGQGAGDSGSESTTQQNPPDAGSPCVPTPEICDGKDNDCDGVIDNGFPLQWDTGNCGACGNSCARPNTVYACVYGVCEWDACQGGFENKNNDWSDGCEAKSCVPSVEICDDIDNDCNSLIDDGLGQTTCGVGACQVTVVNCVNGKMQQCVPKSGSEEICDGIDNDCNGLIDENNVCGQQQPDAGAPQNQNGHTVRVVYPATSCLNTDMVGGWPKVCENGPFDHTWQGVSAGLKRMNSFVSGQWLCSEPSQGNAVAPFGMPTVFVDGVQTQAILTHDWRMQWGCNIMLCVGGACELCCDGIDNDGDGKTDLADPDCFDASYCAP